MARAETFVFSRARIPSAFPSFQASCSRSSWSSIGAYSLQIKVALPVSLNPVIESEIFTMKSKFQKGGCSRSRNAIARDRGALRTTKGSGSRKQQYSSGLHRKQTLRGTIQVRNSPRTGGHCKLDLIRLSILFSQYRSCDETLEVLILCCVH